MSTSTVIVVSFLFAVAGAITPTPECFSKARTEICNSDFKPDLYFCLNNSRVVYDHVSFANLF